MDAYPSRKGFDHPRFGCTEDSRRPRWDGPLGAKDAIAPVAGVQVGHPVAATRSKPIPSLAAGQPVAASVPSESVIPGPAKEHVSSRAAAETVGTGPAAYPVGAAAAVYGCARASRDDDDVISPGPAGPRT